MAGGVGESLHALIPAPFNTHAPPPYTPTPYPPHVRRLEKHELMEFRRIAAFIYKRNLKWRKAVALAKTDKLYKDAMETAAQVSRGRGCPECASWSAMPSCCC